MHPYCLDGHSPHCSRWDIPVGFGFPTGILWENVWWGGQVWPLACANKYWLPYWHHCGGRGWDDWNCGVCRITNKFFNEARGIHPVEDHSCMLRPCGAIVFSLCCQFRSMVLRKLRACGDCGCAWMKSTMCISMSEMPWWSLWLKWCPMVSLTFLDVML